MKYKQGVSGNPFGRPAGAKNKVAVTLRDTIAGFLEEKFETIKEDFDELPARDRAKLYTDLLQYSVPKLQSMALQTEFDTLSDEQLDKIIDQLRNSSKYD